MTNVMDKAALQDYLSKEFGPVGAALSIEDVTEQSVTLRLTPERHHIRLGGTVSGPSLFMLADVGFFFAILARLGPVAMAVTTNASIDFMRKPASGKDLLAKCTLLKLGKILAVGDVLIYSVGEDKPVARSTMTYSIPPK